MAEQIHATQRNISSKLTNSRLAWKQDEPTDSTTNKAGNERLWWAN